MEVQEVSEFKTLPEKGMHVAEVPITWKTAKILNSPKHAPKVSCLLAKKETRTNVYEVFITTPNDSDLMEIRDWIKTNIKTAPKLYARYSYLVKMYQTVHDFRGIIFVFTDINDCLFFKLRWSGIK